MQNTVKVNGEKIHLEEITQDTWREYVLVEQARLTLVLLLVTAKDIDANIAVRLTEPGAEANIIGIVAGKGKGKLRLQTLQHHEARDTTSNLLVKSVLNGTSTFTYEGSISVDPVAQKTDAYQRNENLLLSRSAHVESSPALEIQANDVRCTHGATIAAVNPEQLWYLASRGIDEKRGTTMIAQGFLEGAIAAMPDTIKERIAKQISTFI